MNNSSAVFNWVYNGDATIVNYKGTFSFFSGIDFFKSNTSNFDSQTQQKTFVFSAALKLKRQTNRQTGNPNRGQGHIQ
jgi:hypothetical protein